MQRNRYEVSTEQEPDAFKMRASFMRSNVLERPKITYRCREKDVLKQISAKGSAVGIRKHDRFGSKVARSP